MSLSLGQHYFHNGDINPDITVHYSDSFSKPPRFTFLIYLKISISFSLIFLNDCKLSKSLISRWFLFMLCGGSIVYLFESHAVNDTKANKYSHSFDDIDDLNQGTANFELYLSGIYDKSYMIHHISVFGFLISSRTTRTGRCWQRCTLQALISIIPMFASIIPLENWLMIKHCQPH